MTVISSTGPGLLYRIGASRATITAPSGASMPDLPTRLTLGKSTDRSAVYSAPHTTSGASHLWSSSANDNDTISALMARNRDMRSYALGDQWRGLGGALLTRFGKTGESYSQTLVDDRTTALGDELAALPPEERAQRAATILAMQKADISNVATNAPTAGLKIQTRSGQSVELKISVNPGFGAIVGMKVELKASGSMSPQERAAVEQLADGLDRALEGLGRDDAVGLDLSGLMRYDRQVIASIDLQADNQTHQPLGTFSLHLGDDKQSIALKGSDGELTLNVNAQTPLGHTPAQQRLAAIERTLDRMDRAGERGQANAALIEQMKSAFKAFQAPARDLGGGMDAPTAASHLSGLADFDASFGGETSRPNRFGSTHQAGQVHYQLSQTSTTNGDGIGRGSVAQTLTERLSADFRQAAAPDGMLDVRTGNYSTTAIRDSSTVTTWIESAADRVTSVRRQTDEDLLETVTDIQNHRTTNSQSWPSKRSFMERLH